MYQFQVDFVKVKKQGRFQKTYFLSTQKCNFLGQMTFHF